MTFSAIDILREIVRANNDAPGFGMRDQRDNHGDWYQSAYLANWMLRAQKMISTAPDTDMVRAAVIEEAAKVAEGFAERWGFDARNLGCVGDFHNGGEECAKDIATAIRALARPSSDTQPETWASINEWCDTTFGVATVPQIVARAKTLAAIINSNGPEALGKEALNAWRAA